MSVFIFVMVWGPGLYTRKCLSIMEVEMRKRKQHGDVKGKENVGKRVKRKMPVGRSEDSSSLPAVASLGMTQDGGAVDSGGMTRRENNGGRLKAVAVIVGIVALILAVVLGFRACGGDLEKLILGMPEYEDSIYDGDGEGAESERINLAVVPDMVVTKDRKDFPLPYPEENVYDVEFSFVNEENVEVYHTKRIKPGTIMSVPAYDFCEDGEHKYQIEVEVYDRDTFKPIQSAVALEMMITKK